MTVYRFSHFLRRLAFFVVCLFAHLPIVFAQVIVLDPGHNPEVNGDFSKSGVIGTCGQPEYVYNDQATDELTTALSSTGFTVVRTRQRGEHRSLYARSAIANSAHCSALISIHHDSTAEKNKTTEPGICSNPITGTKSPGLRLKNAFMNRFNVGYNIFVSGVKTSTTRDGESLALAAAIAKRIQEMGRTPSNYHAALRDCPSCKDVNPELGIMSKNLAVLRTTKCPAVLIEVGNVVDPTDERIVNNDEFRRRFAEQVGKGLSDYFSQAH